MSKDLRYYFRANNPKGRGSISCDSEKEVTLVKISHNKNLLKSVISGDKYVK